MTNWQLGLTYQDSISTAVEKKNFTIWFVTILLTFSPLVESECLHPKLNELVQVVHLNRDSGKNRDYIKTIKPTQLDIQKLEKFIKDYDSNLGIIETQDLLLNFDKKSIDFEFLNLSPFTYQQ